MKKTNVQKMIAILIIGLLMMGGWESCKKDDNDGPQEREKTEDTTSKIFYFDYSETEAFVRSLPDEEHSTPLILSQADSLYYDQIVQEFLMERLGTSLSKKGTIQDQALDAISSGYYVDNLCPDKFNIEYTHWDAGKWGIANWGNFETFVLVLKVKDTIVALITLYKKDGFHEDGTAYIKLSSATYGQVLAHQPFKKAQNLGDKKIPGQYICLPLILETNNKRAPFMYQGDGINIFNLCPVIISNNRYRSYDNSIYFQTISKNKSYIAVNGTTFLSESNNQVQGCEYVCAKYINVVAKTNRAVWASAKYWPEILKVADEGFDVYPYDGTVQVREGDILCFAPTSPNKDYHVGVVTKIAPGQKATIVHTDNNNVFDWNTEVVINDKRDIELETITHITKRETELGTITHIIRKSSPYDTEVGAKYSEVHSVKPIVIENLQHFRQAPDQCNASAYVIAASTFKRVLGDDSYIADIKKAEEVYDHKTGYKEQPIVGESMWHACYCYCNTVDGDFLQGEFCSITRPGHSEDNKDSLVKSILENLDQNRIIIADMRGTFDSKDGVNEWEKDCYYSDDPSVNPDLSDSPKYFTKSGSGHVIGIVSIKIAETGEGIVGYYDTMAKSREGGGKNNIRYVSLKNFLISNLNAETSKGNPLRYDAYSVGLKDGKKPIVFEINLSKNDNIYVNDKLELIILSDIVSDFKVMVDGKVIDQSNYNTLSKSKKAIILPTKEAKTYHGTVKTTYEGDDYEENFSYIVNNKKEDNPEPQIQFTSVTINGEPVSEGGTFPLKIGERAKLIVNTNITCDMIKGGIGTTSSYDNNVDYYEDSFYSDQTGSMQYKITASIGEQIKTFTFDVIVKDDTETSAPIITSVKVNSNSVPNGDTKYFNYGDKVPIEVNTDIYCDEISIQFPGYNNPKIANNKKDYSPTLDATESGKVTITATKDDKTSTFVFDIVVKKEFQPIVVPNVSASEPTITATIVASMDEGDVDLKPNLSAEPYVIATYYGKGELVIEKSSGVFTGESIGIYVVRTDTPSGLQRINLWDSDKGKVSWIQSKCNGESSFTININEYDKIESKTKYYIAVSSYTNGHEYGYYLGPLVLEPED